MNGLIVEDEESAADRYAKASAQLRIYYGRLCEMTAPNANSPHERVEELVTLALDACNAMARIAPAAVRARRSLAANALDERAAGAQTLEHLESMRLDIRRRSREHEVAAVHRQLTETVQLYSSVRALVEDADPALERLNAASLDQRDDIERASRAVVLRAGRAMGFAEATSPPTILALLLCALLALTLLVGTPEQN